MRVGLFGGSFDPIHRGHIEPVQEARLALGLERVVFLPTARPPHKPGHRLAPALARYAMTELALLDEEGVEVSTVELTRDQPAYTIDSLEHFGRIHGDDQVTLLMGSDSLAHIESWRRWREIVGRYGIGVLTRPGTDRAEVRDRLPEEVLEAEAAGRIQWVTNTPIEVSSSEVRRRLTAAGDLPSGWVPELVLKYLRKYPNLYA